MHTTPETRPSLLLRLRNPQDEQAWREFLELYEPLIERLARRRGLQHADARELVQEVLVAVEFPIAVEIIRSRCRNSAVTTGRPAHNQ